MNKTIWICDCCADRRLISWRPDAPTKKLKLSPADSSGLDEEVTLLRLRMDFENY